MRHVYVLLLLVAIACGLSGCAGLPGHEQIQVAVADIEPLPGEGMEVRMLVKLRVQNPNDAPLDYDGVSLKLNVEGNTFASGVSDARGTIPRFGEAVIEVPVTISMLRVALHAFHFVMDDKGNEKVHYELYGRLGGSAFGSASFSTEGELALPKP
jgi:LEA14-like dessication related protein